MTDKIWTRNGEPMAYGPFVSDGVEHPAAALTNWSDLELAAHGIVRTEVPTPEPTLDERLAALADYRWKKTQTMPAYSGATDVPADTARSVVTSKVLAAQFMTEEQKLERHAFKLKPGEWRDWNLPDLIAYGLAIGTYMQLCFDREAALEVEISAAYPAPVDITPGWPS
jgi:hypothetical protein